jgi:hypothetical protein
MFVSDVMFFLPKKEWRYLWIVTTVMKTQEGKNNFSELMKLQSKSNQQSKKRRRRRIERES